MDLQYLDFDFSDDGEGHGSFDAMASAAPPQVAALQAEIERVLHWAHHVFPGVRGPLDDGGDWDYALQGQRELATEMDVDYDAASGRIALREAASAPPRLVLTLTLGGTLAFCSALRDAFSLD